MKQERFSRRWRWGAIVPALIVLLGLLQPVPSFAGSCENSGSATASLVATVAHAAKTIAKYVKDALAFVQALIPDMATPEMMIRLTEFDGNIRTALITFSDRLIEALKIMTTQLSVAQVEQTRAIGYLMDAQLLNEAALRKSQRQDEAHRRYLPSEQSCPADTVGPGQAKAYQMSRAFSRAFTLGDSPRRSNAKGSISATGTAAETRALWDEYVAKFCDNTKGDQGCTSPGPLAGKHKDIPALLWGDRQTMDMNNPDNQFVVDAALRNLIAPRSSDIILPGAALSASGHQALLARRAEQGRANAIYHVMSQMIGERAGGSGVNAQPIRAAAGVPAAEASADASYSELRETMTRDLYYNPEYLVRLVNNPEQAAREQISANAARLQLMNDIYRRSEELLFMEASIYSRDLDQQIPSSAVKSSPLR